MEERETVVCSQVMFSINDFLRDDEYQRKLVVMSRELDQTLQDIAEEKLEDEYFEWLDQEKARTGTFKNKQVRKRRYLKITDPKRQTEVNKKWDSITQAIRVSSKVNFQQIAKRTGTHSSTVKRVFLKMKLMGEVPRYQYSNLHSQESVTALHNTIEELRQDFMTASQIKKLHSNFSKKRIRAEIKERDFRWRKLPVLSKKKIRYPPPSDEELTEMARKIIFVHMQEDSELLYCDEMKLPLNQTPQNFWTKQDAMEDRVFNGREEKVHLTAIVLCSKKGFVAVQFFIDEVNGLSFLYFIQEVIKTLPTDKKYRILVDNAKWHLSNIVKESAAYRFLLFNLPRQYMFNLIENSFAQVRYAFRCRHSVSSLVDEFEALAHIFFDSDQQKSEKRFAGYYRNHLRVLDKMIHLDYPK